MKILVIQTAFIGDAILGTAMLEKLHHAYPAAKIDYLVRKGNENLFTAHPYLHELLVWDKGSHKMANLWAMARYIRKGHYDYVVNAHRHISSAFLTLYSGAQHRFGFDSSLLSVFFTKRYPHDIGNGRHETERNQDLIREITDEHTAKPRLYPSKTDEAKVSLLLNSEPGAGIPYCCLAPASVWFTKQFPEEKWMGWIRQKPQPTERIFLIGAASDAALCERIRTACPSFPITSLAGKLTLLESAALMKGARMNYVNDSAPMHIASSMNAPVTAIFVSTVPRFGFGPLSDKQAIIETKEKLTCRPCGLHGFKSCPKKHFKCATTIAVETIH
ncbi:MAG: glycosyltransferase family 9 protein [Bacteroidia bacterium]